MEAGGGTRAQAWGVAFVCVLFCRLENYPPSQAVASQSPAESNRALPSPAQRSASAFKTALGTSEKLACDPLAGTVVGPSPRRCCLRGRGGPLCCVFVPQLLKPVRCYGFPCTTFMRNWETQRRDRKVFCGPFCWVEQVCLLPLAGASQVWLNQGP